MVQRGGGQVLRALGRIEGRRARQERRLVEDRAVRPPDPEGVLEVRVGLGRRGRRGGRRRPEGSARGHGQVGHPGAVGTVGSAHRANRGRRGRDGGHRLAGESGGREAPEACLVVVVVVVPDGGGVRE